MATRSVMKPMQVGGLRRAALREQARQPRYVTDDIDNSVRRVGRDVVTLRRCGDALAEKVCHSRDVADDVYMAIAVDVRGPGVHPAPPQWIGTNDPLRHIAPAVAVRILKNVNSSSHGSGVDLAVIKERARAIERVRERAGGHACRIPALCGAAGSESAVATGCRGMGCAAHPVPGDRIACFDAGETDAAGKGRVAEPEIADVHRGRGRARLPVAGETDDRQRDRDHGDFDGQTPAGTYGLAHSSDPQTAGTLECAGRICQQKPDEPAVRIEQSWACPIMRRRARKY